MARKRLHSSRSSAPPLPDSHSLRLVQNVFFKTTTVIIGRRRETMPLIQAYLHRQTNAAAEGNARCRREVIWLVKQLGKRAIDRPRDDETGPIAASRRKFAAERAAHAIKTAEESRKYGIFVITTWNDFCKNYKVNVPIDRADQYVHYAIDMKCAWDFVEHLKRSSQRKLPKGDYKVGHSKPPVDKQWRPGQSGNPSGVRKSQPTWDYIGTMLSAIVPIQLQDGTRTQSTKISATVHRLIADAVAGDAGACQDMRALIQILDEHDLLCAPEKAPRASRRSATRVIDPLEKAKFLLHLRIFMSHVKRDLVESFDRKHGEAPRFTTALERMVEHEIARIDPALLPDGLLESCRAVCAQIEAYQTQAAELDPELDVEANPPPPDALLADHDEITSAPAPRPRARKRSRARIVEARP